MVAAPPFRWTFGEARADDSRLDATLPTGALVNRLRRAHWTFHRPVLRAGRGHPDDGTGLDELTGVGAVRCGRLRLLWLVAHVLNWVGEGAAIESLDVGIAAPVRVGDTCEQRGVAHGRQR